MFHLRSGRHIKTFTGATCRDSFWIEETLLRRGEMVERSKEEGEENAEIRRKMNTD